MVMLPLTVSLLAAGIQRGPVGSANIYAFTPQQLTAWYRSGAIPQLPILPHGMKLKPPTTPTVSVHIIGNFSGTFNVHGAGSGASAQSDNFIDITTTEALMFTASSFTSLQLNSAPASSVGSITYEMQIYAGTSSSVGSPLTSAVSGTDAGFNGQSIILPLGSIPGDNRVVLRLSRILSINQLAAGAKDYTASGTISVSIN